MKPYYFHPESLAEAEHAAKFYEEKQVGLGARFLDAVEDALTRIQRHPRLFQIVSGTIRKCRILRFPYGVIFREQHARIEIICHHAFEATTWVLEDSTIQVKRC